MIRLRFGAWLIMTDTEGIHTNISRLHHGANLQNITRKALRVLKDEDYENAKKYLRMISRKDKNYPDAIKKLKKIEKMNIKKKIAMTGISEHSQDKG
jgi:phenylacetate-coenzyme A ligase PaaK-like adenylate-forming protein